MSASQLYLFPLIVFLIFPLTFITTFTIAVSKDHINAFFSYISDTGTISPELCIFAQLLNLAAVFLGAVVYIRYKQIEEFFRDSDDSTIKRLNEIGASFGIIAALGVSAVGCFQETNVLWAHVIAAIMAFMGGSIFLIFQGFFSLKLLPLFGSKGLAIFRIMIGCICLCLFIVSYTAGTVSLQYFTGDQFLKWKPEDGGWTLRVISITCEWLMAALFDLYFLTFVPEFRKLSYEGPKFRLVTLDTVKDGIPNGSTMTTTAQEKVVMLPVRQDSEL